MILVVLSVPLVFKRPLVGMAIYLGANVIRPEMLFWGGGGGAYVFKVYYGLLLVTTFIRGYMAEIRRIFNREFLLMVWLFVAVMVSMAFAQYPIFRGDYYMYELLKGFGICALLYVIARDYDEVRTLQNVLLWCFAFMGIWGIQQQFLGNERLEGLGGSSWGDSNGVAAAFVLFLPVALAKLFTAETRKEYWRAAGIVAIIVALIVCTKSRAGLLGLITGVASYGYYSRSVRKIAVTFLLMAVVAMPFATKAYMDRMKTMESEESLDPSARSRLVLWQAGLMVFADNPFFGTGFLTYPEAKMKYESRFMDLDEEFRDWVFRNEAKKVTHNTYIQMMSDCGLFGAIPFVLLVFGGIFAGFRARRLFYRYPGKAVQLKLLCGISAGITGFAVCIFTLDAVLEIFLYIQLVFVGILSRMLSAEDVIDSHIDPMSAAPGGDDV